MIAQDSTAHQQEFNVLQVYALLYNGELPRNENVKSKLDPEIEYGDDLRFKIKMTPLDSPLERRYPPEDKHERCEDFYTGSLWELVPKDDVGPRIR